MMKYDYSKLKGRIAEKDENYTSLCKKIGITTETFRRRLRGDGFFRQTEIIAICNVLDIDYADIPMYFFVC